MAYLIKRFFNSETGEEVVPKYEGDQKVYAVSEGIFKPIIYEGYVYDIASCGLEFQYRIDCNGGGRYWFMGYQVFDKKSDAVDYAIRLSHCKKIKFK